MYIEEKIEVLIHLTLPKMKICFFIEQQIQGKHLECRALNLTMDTENKAFLEHEKEILGPTDRGFGSVEKACPETKTTANN